MVHFDGAKKEIDKTKEIDKHLPCLFDVRSVLTDYWFRNYACGMLKGFGQGDPGFFLLAEICLSNAPLLFLAAKLWLDPRTHLNYHWESKVFCH